MDWILIPFPFRVELALIYAVIIYAQVCDQKYK